MITTNPKENGPLVTVSHIADGEPISFFLDPNCPDYSDKFVHWEALQSSLLRALSNHNADDWQAMGLVQKLAEELKMLLGEIHNLRLEAETVKRGQGILDQRLDGVQSKQSHIIQVRHRHHILQVTRQNICVKHHIIQVKNMHHILQVTHQNIHVEHCIYR